MWNLRGFFPKQTVMTSQDNRNAGAFSEGCSWWAHSYTASVLGRGFKIHSKEVTPGGLSSGNGCAGSAGGCCVSSLSQVKSLWRFFLVWVSSRALWESVGRGQASVGASPGPHRISAEVSVGLLWRTIGELWRSQSRALRWPLWRSLQRCVLTCGRLSGSLWALPVADPYPTGRQGSQQQEGVSVLAKSGWSTWVMLCDTCPHTSVRVHNQVLHT